MCFILWGGMHFDFLQKIMLSKHELIQESQQIKIFKHLKAKLENFDFLMIGIEK